MVRSVTMFFLGHFFATSGLAAANQGTATLALEEVLRLHKASSDTPVKAPPPPVNHAVSRFEARARIIGDALEASASVHVAVFADGWTSIALLQPDPDLDVTALPTVENGHFVMHKGALNFITQKAGSYVFDIGFIKRSLQRARSREILLRPARATITKLQLTYDENLFEVTSIGARREGDTLVVFARDGLLRLSWMALSPRTGQPDPHRKRPPIAPVVTSADASVVVTLDGQRITRSLYRLRLQGQQTLTVTVPPDQELTTVYLNGLSRPFKLTDGQANISVAPPRLGDQRAVVEVVLKAKTTPMALAGTLSFILPRLSWTVNEMTCKLYLPNVFNYTWVGGSLSPGEVETAPQYTLDIPTPGKKVEAKQQLVNGTPDTVVEYAVDLAGNYFQ